MVNLKAAFGMCSVVDGREVLYAWEVVLCAFICDQVPMLVHF